MMRKLAAALLCALFAVGCLTAYSDSITDNLAEGIVRLHVIANSDSEEDQRVKLLVRDALLEKMKKFNDKSEIPESVDEFKEIAAEVLKTEGFDYSAEAEYGNFEFPTKYYDNFALPKGNYDAVRIVLGKGEGHNWWCVLFPPLCYVDAAGDEQDALLKETFGENYSLVKEGEGRIPVKIKFKIAELF
jgi:stage II sporulation protein R